VTLHLACIQKENVPKTFTSHAVILHMLHIDVGWLDLNTSNFEFQKLKIMKIYTEGHKLTGIYSLILKVNEYGPEWLTYH
jgi:hypothetical protein